MVSNVNFSVIQPFVGFHVHTKHNDSRGSIVIFVNLQSGHECHISHRSTAEFKVTGTLISNALFLFGLFTSGRPAFVLLVEIVIPEISVWAIFIKFCYILHFVNNAS